MTCKIIAEKVQRGERLSFEDGVALYRSPELASVGRIANVVRERLNANKAYFNVNRHINYTNVCAIDCQLCQGAYARKPGEDGGYTMQLDQVFRFAEQEYSDSLTEFHVVGGLNPELPFSYYTDLLQGLRNRFPQVHLKAFTMVELDFFAKITRQPLEWVIEKVREAGLGSCPGGGAEIFAERARPLIAGHKISGKRWLEVAQAVHKMGIRSNATMLYGHIETLEERVDHLIRLRELQDETGRLPVFHSAGVSPREYVLREPASDRRNRRPEDHRRLAPDARQLSAHQGVLGDLDAFPGQVALRFGADDLDGTIIEERIIHGAGTPTRRE
jgi:aminodeoxyfutalosine synthase